jgi:dTDP-4-amino-4,6-dideoxygalactose transaminase
VPTIAVSKHLVLVANATLGLSMALRQLGLRGEVITTPFSFVATANSLVWGGLTPVFADIDPDTLNLNPDSVRAAITPATTAILPVHCFGRTCDVAAIDEIAREHGLKVLYDAAHAFGVTDAGGSVLRYGDLSVVSFHATKVFNTGEGGAIVCPDADTKLALDQMKNHGIADDKTKTAASVGLNAKLNEIAAALGLLQLRHVDSEIEKRGAVDARYRELLSDIPGIALLQPDPAARHNFYSFPIIVNDQYGESRDALDDRLHSNGIYSRRYFSPLISELPMYRGHPSAAPRNLPRASFVSSRILGLPLYPDLPPARQRDIADLIRRAT